MVCDNLNISNTQIEIDHLEVGNSTTGMCIDISSDSYLILVDSERSEELIIRTILHELVHIKQYIFDGLGVLLETQTDVPYHRRWWEEEARTISDQMYNKYILT